MKKIILLFAIVSLLFSCSNDENNAIQEKENTPPSAPVLKKTEELEYKYITLSWSASKDTDNDKITYDVYANNEIIKKDTEKLTYTYKFDEINAKYPVTFKITAKDTNNNQVTSNEITITEPINTAPTAPILKKQEEIGNVNINFEWSPSTDAESDKIVYDIYANNEIVESNISELTYNFLFNEGNTKYPIIFKVVAKDIKGNKTNSNEIEIVDPLIGKWFTSKIEYIENGVVIEEKLPSGCEKQTYLEFKDNNTSTFKSFAYDNNKDECSEKDESSRNWTNIGKNNMYSISFNNENVEIVFLFSKNNKFMYSQSEPNAEQIVTKFYFEKR